MGARVERRRQQALVDQFHALADGAALLVDLAGQQRQVLIALLAQQLHEALLIARQAVGLQPGQLAEVVQRRSHRRVQAAGFGAIRQVPTRIPLQTGLLVARCTSV